MIHCWVRHWQRCWKQITTRSIAPAMDKLARDLATAVEYELILLDVQVPKQDGISLCRQLRSQGYRKSIVMLTGNYSDADVVALFDAKADDYISKPCTSEVLRVRMRTLLRRIWSVMPSNSRLPIPQFIWVPKTRQTLCGSKLAIADEAFLPIS